MTFFVLLPFLSLFFFLTQFFNIESSMDFVDHKLANLETRNGFHSVNYGNRYVP